MSILKSINPATEELFAEFKEINSTLTKEIISKSSESQKNWSNIDIKQKYTFAYYSDFSSHYSVLNSGLHKYSDAHT